MFQIRWFGVSVLVAASSVAACGGSSTMTNSNSVDNSVKVQALPSLAFAPTVVTIRPGESVTWVFGTVGHTVTFDSAAGVPENIPGPTTNTSISRTFATAGIFHYHCSIHTSMTGVVGVGDNPVITPPPPPPPPPPGYVKTGP